MLKFIGRIGQESYKVEGPDGLPALDKEGNEQFAKRDQQQFKGGVMIVRESFQAEQTVYEAMIDNKGNPIVDANGMAQKKAVKQVGTVNKQYSLRPGDIGKSFEFVDEADVLKRYPVSFAKA